MGIAVVRRGGFKTPEVGRIFLDFQESKEKATPSARILFLRNNDGLSDIADLLETIPQPLTPQGFMECRTF